MEQTLNIHLKAISFTVMTTLFTVSCQTRGVDPSVDPVLGFFAQQVVSETCVIVNTNNTSEIGSSSDLYATLINEVSVQPDGWALIDFSIFPMSQRLNGQAIFNTNTLKGACSASRENAQLLFGLTSYAAVIKNTSTHPKEFLREYVKDYTFPIQATWSGDGRIYHGEYVFRRESFADGAWISIDTPYDSKPCTGQLFSLNPYFKPAPNYILQSSCPNGKDFTGKFYVPFPTGKTVKSFHVPKKIVGSGTDNHGRNFAISVN